MTYNPQQLSEVIEDVFYPESDGKPMADNTIQFDLIVRIKTNLETLYQGVDVFIAGDLFWYPVNGDAKTVQAPDVMVVFGRPKEDKGSYKQWKENNIPPQVVFEVLSPSNTEQEMERKRQFYEKYGVEEYIVIDPKKTIFRIYTRQIKGLEQVSITNDAWVSPLMNITICVENGQFQFYHPDGQPFRMLKETDQLWKAASVEVVKEQKMRRKEERMRKEEERMRKEEQRMKEEERRLKEEALKADAEKAKEIELLKEKLRALGQDI